MENGINSK